MSSGLDMPTSNSTLSGATTCSLAEELLATQTNRTAISCLSRTESIGLSFITMSGFVSLAAVLGVFGLILESASELQSRLI